jgi:hypothetical protein
MRFKKIRWFLQLMCWIILMKMTDWNAWTMLIIPLMATLSYIDGMEEAER